MRKPIHPRALRHSGPVRGLRAALEGCPAAVARAPGFHERYSAQGKVEEKAPMAAAWRAAGKVIGKLEQAAVLRSVADGFSRSTP